MKTSLGFLLMLFLSYHSISQECRCPNTNLGLEHAYPVKIFSFSNGEDIGLCGDFERKDIDTIYSEFTLYHCSPAIVIGEWGAVKPCKVSKIEDTLFVTEIQGLPIGFNFSFIDVPFYTYSYFFKDSKLTAHTSYTQYPKYNKSQIEQIITEYNKLSPGNYEHTVEVAWMLFWAFVSRSKEAEKHLINIEKNLGPFDGVVKEDWNDVRTTYKQWKGNNK